MGKDVQLPFSPVEQKAGMDMTLEIALRKRKHRKLMGKPPGKNK